MADKGMQPECNLCGHSQWAVLGLEHDMRAAVPLTWPVEGAQVNTTYAHMHFLVMLCEHCGNARFVLKGIIDSWKATKAKDNDAEPQ